MLEIKSHLMLIEFDKFLIIKINISSLQKFIDKSNELINSKVIFSLCATITKSRSF